MQWLYFIVAFSFFEQYIYYCYSLLKMFKCSNYRDQYQYPILKYKSPSRLQWKVLSKAWVLDINRLHLSMSVCECKTLPHVLCCIESVTGNSHNALFPQHISNNAKMYYEKAFLSITSSPSIQFPSYRSELFPWIFVILSWSSHANVSFRSLPSARYTAASDALILRIYIWSKWASRLFAIIIIIIYFKSNPSSTLGDCKKVQYIRMYTITK